MMFFLHLTADEPTRAFAPLLSVLQLAKHAQQSSPVAGRGTSQDYPLQRDAEAHRARAGCAQSSRAIAGDKTDGPFPRLSLTKEAVSQR